MDKYDIEKSLGAGNYGEVSLVRSKKNGQLFVIKRIDLSQKSASQQKEAENEVRTMSKLNHPNIVQFVEAFIENKALWIVMEHADSGDLENELLGYCNRKHYMPEDKIMNIFIQIALGLRQLHKQHLLHRDLKSANVFMTAAGGVKLGDFGFAKQLNYTMALASTVCGTPYYFSPELCQRLPYNNKSDVWSLGVILYEMINLQKPFEAKNLPELRKRVVTEEPAPFSNHAVSNDLKELVFMMLRKSSAARPSVDAVLQTQYVRKYITKFSEQLQKQQSTQAERVLNISTQHARRASEVAFDVVFAEQQKATQQNKAPQQSTNPSVTSRQVFDRNAFRQQLKSGTTNDAGLIVNSPLTHASQPQAPQEGSHAIFNRQLPDAHTVVSNDTPLTVVAELTEALIQQESCKALQSDLQEVLSSFDIDEVIGEAESDEERMLREELGEKFVKAIELALKLQEAPLHSAEAEKYLKELLQLLAQKQYLLADVQRVASFFEVAE
ncbi:serine-threonine protein kinase, putative [Bodo saltans]|uniref:non-specific serine/threonine protein kinase n=1 Tax=Bodo saltans TaxID=75058 RepID=A0A0S4JNA1_BODSA|nr:serine-threonine protein kinase, putative [Bodo saltans]|eukprot:CUG91630.1 serine-threonine protein kinase, putative [Bodo saltans]